MFKVGDKIKYIGLNDSPYFTTGSIYEIVGESGPDMWYITDNEGMNSNGGNGHCWPKRDLHEFFRPMPVGPVVTETVTKTRIVPGVYDGVRVKINPTPGKVFVYIHETLLDADQLDAAAAVLSALAKGLRDA